MLKWRKLSGSISAPLGGSGTLSAPVLSYPSPIASNPTTIVVNIGPDWISGNTFKLARGATLPLTTGNATVLTHAITNADITAGAFSIGLSGVTLSGETYFEGFGNDGTNDSQYLSAIVAWGDTTAPVITTSATPAGVHETVPLALPLTYTDAGGVPALVSNGTTPGWFIAGGPDQLQVQVAIVSGSPVVQWFGNKSQSFYSDYSFDRDNIYDFTVGAIDYSGNLSTLAIAQAVLAINQTPTAFTFTNVNPAALNTLYQSNVVTMAGMDNGYNISLVVSGQAGFQYSINGGAWKNVTGAQDYIQNGQTLQLQGTSANANSTSESVTVTVGNPYPTVGYQTSWVVATPGSSALLTSTTGTSKSQYENVASPYLQAIMNNNVGLCSPVRATAHNSNTKFHCEIQATYFQASGGNSHFYCGFDDNTVGFNTFVSNTSLPGYSGSGHNGFTVHGIKGQSSVTIFHSGGSLTPTLPNALTDGDWFAFDIDNSANTVLITYYHGGTATVLNSGSAITLTSLIPSVYWSFIGGGDGNGTAGTGSSDTITVNYGASSWLVTPQTGYSYYA